MNKIIRPNWERDYVPQIRRRGMELDMQDLNDAASQIMSDHDAFARQYRAQAGGMRRRASPYTAGRGGPRQAYMGGRNRAVAGQARSVRADMIRQNGTCPTSPYDNNSPCDLSGVPFTDRCDTPFFCHVLERGFNTLDTANFPLVAPVAPVTVTTAVREVGSGNKCRIRPRFFYMTARESAGFTAVPALLTSVVISGDQQLAQNGGGEAVPTDTFQLANEPLAVSWDVFGNTDGQRLQLELGNFLPAQTVHFFGVVLGDPA